MTKKLFATLVAVSLLAGCQTMDAVVEDAQELKASVIEKVTEIKTGIENVVGEAKHTYAVLMDKKAELEAMIAEINEAVDSVNKLLGKDETDAAEAEDLRVTIADLQAALAAAESTLDEVEVAEEELAENSDPEEENSAESEAPADETVTE